MADKSSKPPKPESLDEIVRRSAVVIAQQIQNAAGWAKSEMDLQVEVAGFLKDFAREAKINPLEGHQNVTIATGRADSVYGSVIVEYKRPGTLSPNKEAAPNKAVIDQLKRRFYDMNREEHRNWRSMFGVGTDGKYFIFLRFRDDKWTDQEPLEVNRYSTERFLWALYNLGQKGKSYQPEYLHGDFGSESPIAQEGVRTLCEEIQATDNPRAQVFFNQWKILFGEVCGYDVENLSDKLKKLAEFYHVKGKPQPAALLFAVHTYYAILIKLLAAETVSFFNPWMTRQVERLQSATTRTKLRRELEELERGGVFHTLGITNFLEGDLFSWYLAVWSEPIERLTRKMVTKLDEYNPGTFSEDPAQSRDLLKKLYQQLFPKSVRHDLGEYFTPDWLAQHVLNELGYEGDPDKRLLDPACGSGTFLVMAINRIRRWYDHNREKCAYDEGELLRKILANVIGFDLNPLAVMAARTNYLVAIKDLIRHVEKVEIPVYLCDSIMTPAEYGDLFTGSQGTVAKVPCGAMKPSHLLVPKEIARSPMDVATYAAMLEMCVGNGYSASEFLSRCRDEGLEITATEAHLGLYKELVKLDKANKNGIWARIIKNNFAPLFIGRVDYVTGNPPWVNWESLPAEYRQASKSVWEYFGLFTLKGHAARLGGGKKDLSMLFVYQCLESYLARDGRLGFVITQTLFKTREAGEGFRRFTIKAGGGARYIVPLKVIDMTDLHPFEGATNRTAVFTCKSAAKPTTWPVAYETWWLKEGRRVSDDTDLKEILRGTVKDKMGAFPMTEGNACSAWLTAPREAMPGLNRIVGQTPIKAHAGVCTWMNGVFWLSSANEISKGRVRITNWADVGKIKVEPVQAVLESDLIYPLLRGRDVHRWESLPSAHIILTQDPRTRTGISQTTMKHKYPLTYEYLLRFESILRNRPGYLKYFDPDRDPFWTVYNIGGYSISPFRVVFKELTDFFQCAVPEATGKPPIADTKLRFIQCVSSDAAYFVCALLNSSPSVLYLYSTATWVQTADYQASDISRIRLPEFEIDNPLHRSITEVSRKCHSAATRGDEKRLTRLEAEIDDSAARLWGITGAELKAIQEALVRAGKSRRSAKEPTDCPDDVEPYE
jgi:hypothetical protein